MPPKHRLSRAQFPRRAARRAFGEILSLSVSPLPDDGRAKFACVVTKKLARRAVDRNSLKRRCREAARPLIHGLSPLAIVAHPKKAALSASVGEIRDELRRLLRALR